ncbi:Maf family protein [Acinetobacter junii]|uniref:Maf family protein n=1 Tax=Acinetobacter junii TaxID=40215 RepID=UPI00244D3197|nr:Maf family protein [Acinetobacter junii]MDH1689869.1 Maf family nucleotide pyrophosphatase [Acinetobacter junii]
MRNIELILASSSQTRKDLMDRLRLDYRCISPDIDESAKDELHADDLAKRLAYEKAKVISQQHPNAIVIGSDQVAWREHTPSEFIGKPLSIENAIQQLQLNSGKTIFFSTALSVQYLDSGFETTLVEHYQVKFRELTLNEIKRYIEIDQPLNCAGSFKCESLGISLFEKMIGDDQTTLMGLPMIQLCKILRVLRINVP